MSDIVQVAWIGFFGAALNALVGFMNYLHIKDAKTAIVTLEKNTNSIKDALVKVTEEKAFAAGLKQGTESKRTNE